MKNEGAPPSSAPSASSEGSASESSVHASVPIGLGCMRLSTALDRDEDGARTVLEAAAAAGIALFDTAPSYAHGEHELHHGERLLQRVLGSHPQRERFTFVTKAGLSRKGSEWIVDGRRKSIESSARASAAIFGGPLDVLLLHAVDPNVPLATSVRALEQLRQRGESKAIGICNVSRRQLEEALDLADLRFLEVAHSLDDLGSERSGVIALAQERGLTVLAHTPLGGPKRAARLGSDVTLSRIAAAALDGRSAAEIALAYLRAQGTIPLVGATRLASIASLARAQHLTLSESERSEVRARRAHAVPALTRAIEVVMLVGSQGSGKSSAVADYQARGLVCLSRDARGGTLSGLAREFKSRLAALSGDPLGRLSDPDRCEGFVLDNTAGTRGQRAEFLAIAKQAGASVRAVWLEAPMAVAQANVVRRIARTLGELPSVEVLQKSKDPRVVPPRALFRYAKDFEPPSLEEGFDAIERRPFERHSGGRARGLAISVNALEALRALPEHDRLLIYGWAPSHAAALRSRIAAQLDGRAAMIALCEHGEGPPVCWCRPPLPGLVAAWVELSDIDVERSILIGKGRIERTIAEGVGLRYEEP